MKRRNTVAVILAAVLMASSAVATAYDCGPCFPSGEIVKRCYSWSACSVGPNFAATECVKQYRLCSDGDDVWSEYCGVGNCVTSDRWCCDYPYDA